VSEDSIIPGPLGDLLRPLQDLATRMTELTQAAAAAGARATPEFLALPLAEVTDGFTRMSEMITGPLRRLLEEQRELAQQMAKWAEKHKELSQQIAGWAEEHRKMTERMQAIVGPMLEQAEGLSSATRTFAEELRHH
jgi:methyl-accepting chemotaxis protein